MKSVILVSLALVAMTAAAAIDRSKDEIVESFFEKEPTGQYVYRYKTSGGLYREEKGTLQQVFDEDKKPHDVIVVSGVYGYTDNDGKPEKVQYQSNEFGYQAAGDSIPKNP